MGGDVGNVKRRGIGFHIWRCLERKALRHRFSYMVMSGTQSAAALVFIYGDVGNSAVASVFIYGGAWEAGMQV